MTIDLGRRRFFGLLAAPAIISITGKLQPALILPSADMTVEQAIIRDGYTRGMDPSAFRAIVEPVLRELFENQFDKTFDKTFDKDFSTDKPFFRAMMGRTPRGDDELRKIRRQLPGLPTRRHDA